MKTYRFSSVTKGGNKIDNLVCYAFDLMGAIEEAKRQCESFGNILIVDSVKEGNNLKSY